MTNTELMALYEDSALTDDKRIELFGKSRDFLYATQARKDGSFGKPTHLDELGRRYRFENAEIIAYEVPKNLTRKSNKGELPYTHHPNPGDKLTLKPDVKNGVGLEPFNIVVTSNMTPYNNKCGTIEFKVVNNDTVG